MPQRNTLYCTLKMTSQGNDPDRIAAVLVEGLLVDPDGNLAYVTDAVGGSTRVTGTFTRSIPVGSGLSKTSIRQAFVAFIAEEYHQSAEFGQSDFDADCLFLPDL